MKIIFMEYLASLKERKELDAILPDLLSEIGLTVISKPSIGTRQHGVDVVAVGKYKDQVRRVFLFSIKAGDLRRTNWDQGMQSLRSSLNEIVDVFIPKLIPKRYIDLPRVVVLCIGGDLHETVREDVDGYMENHANESTKFDLWNGDQLAGHLLSGVLRENFLPKSWRSDFRKCLALVDESQISFEHFGQFATNILEQCNDARRSRLRAIRQIYIGLWTLYAWAREAQNLEAAYLSSERAVLVGWSLAKDHLIGRSKEVRQIRESNKRLIELHEKIAEDYITGQIEPRVSIRHGLTSAVPSQASLDINLRMFDLLSRVGTQGLWLLHHAERSGPDQSEDEVQDMKTKIGRVAKTLVSMISTNPILLSPIKEGQAIDINIACLFLERIGCHDVIQTWIRQISYAVIFAYRSDSLYPCIYEEYRDLINHPQREKDYKIKATEASILIPVLAVWAAIVNDSETLGNISKFVSEELRHCTLQLWYPGSDTEERMYLGGNHGLCAEIEITPGPEDMLSPIKAECSTSLAFCSLSAYSNDLCPLLVMASRHHRMPVAPHLWPL